MLKKCSNCGGELKFSPKDKGNLCDSCGSVFPIEYVPEFVKKPFEESKKMPEDNISDSMKNMRCKSCGANVLLTKLQVQSYCPYCGSSTVDESESKKLMYIDSIIPFSFGKAEALAKFKHAVNKRFYANKNVLKSVKESDIHGSYINAFVFDFDTRSSYSGTFSYQRTYTDSDGDTRSETVYKHVSGVYEKIFSNLAVEANSNLEQRELSSVEPFEYVSAVDFNENFMYGYMLEYQDKMFNDCVEIAEGLIRSNIERALLAKHHCDRIVSIKLDTQYFDKKYNYCLLPIYFVSTQVKDKKYRVVMNGQTGLVGKLPKSVGRILLTVFLIIFGLVGISLFVAFLA